MEWSDKAKRDAARRDAAGHAVQTGVMYQMERDPDGAGATPKHLRTGVNMAMSDQSGLAKLLIDKGVITNDEYCAAIADSAEEEKARCETLLSELFGVNITLG